MSTSIYQRPNKKWKADVVLNGVRVTKTLEKKRISNPLGQGDRTKSHFK